MRETREDSGDDEIFTGNRIVHKFIREYDGVPKFNAGLSNISRNKKVARGDNVASIGRMFLILLVIFSSTAAFINLELGSSSLRNPIGRRSFTAF